MAKSTLTRLMALLAIAFTIFVAVPAYPAVAGGDLSVVGGIQPQGVIDPDLESMLSGLKPGDKTTVVVTLKAQPQGISHSRAQNRTQRREEDARTETQSRQQLAQSTQQGLLSRLRGHQDVGEARDVESLWIFNGIAVTATPKVIRELAAQPEVASISANRVIPQPKPVPLATTAAVAAVQPNLNQIGVPTAWALGASGQGVVVASLDTGVDVTHPDLQSRWRGGSNSWFDPYGQHPTVPTDLSGHGTQTMGLMVGGSASGTSIGVAPNAKWISAKIFNDQGYATTVAIHKAFQWLLNPSGNTASPGTPDIVNNSWATGVVGCDQTFLADVQALQSAGILVVAAAGNYGPNASTDASPANYPGVLSAGAVDGTDTVAGFSSRGATACVTTRTFPEVAAPGVGVTSSDLYGGYYTASGTSYSSPETAGAAALLLSIDPTLSASEVSGLLTSTAQDLAPTGADNSTGHGRINVGTAVSGVVLSPRRQTGGGAAGSSASYGLTLRNSSAASLTYNLVATSDKGYQVTLPASVTVAAGLTQSFTVAVALPSGAASGTVDTTTINATPSTGGTAATATVVTTVTAGSTGGGLGGGPTASDTIFADSFESGSFSAWSSNTGSGISVSTSAKMGSSGSTGMQALIKGNTPGYATEKLAAAEASYHARFYFNPNGAITGGNVQDIFAGFNSGSSRIFRVQYKRTTSGQYQLRAGVLRAWGESFTNWFTVSNSAHPVEIAWQSGSSTSFTLYVDGTAKQTLTKLNTSAYKLTSVSLGPSAGLTGSMSGTEYFDAYVSNRTTVVGP